MPHIDPPLAGEQWVEQGPARVSDHATGELPAVGSEGPSRPSRRRRRLLFAGVVAVAAAAAVGIWLGTSGTSTGVGLHFTTKVEKVTTGTIKETVSASGTIEPAQESDLDFTVSGKVTSVSAEVGQKVTAGERLATVAPTALEAQEAAAQATLTAAESKLSTDEDAGASTSQLASDKASITADQAQVTTAEKSLAAATLTSPITGIVASVNLAVGEQVSGSDSAGSANAAASASAASSSSRVATAASTTTSTGSTGASATSEIVVISAGSFIVNSTVDDTEVGKVAAGDQATVTPTGATTPVYGTVASVGMIASGSSEVASFPVVVDVTGTQTGIYAGSSAEVSITVKQLNNVVEVTTAAISYANGQATVTIVESGGRHVTKSVTVGTAADGKTQITRGLKAGEQVLERVASFTGRAGATTGGARGLFGGAGGPGGGGRFPAGGSGGDGGGFFGGGGAGPGGGFGG